jgi:hypothetical protein
MTGEIMAEIKLLNVFTNKNQIYTIANAIANAIVNAIIKNIFVFHLPLRIVI